MKSNGFHQFKIDKSLISALEKMYIKEPTPIQKEIIPKILKGKSVVGESQTGSGKTFAFLLPLLSKLDSSKNEVQVVITAPTRELAEQLYNETNKLINYAQKSKKLTTQLLVGGRERSEDIRKLKNSLPHIIVGTPHRIYTMIESGVLSIYKTASFVIDEADLIVDLGLIEDIDRLLVRANRNVQLLVFTATIPVQLEHLLRRYLSNPLHIKIDENVSKDLLTHQFIARKHRETKNLIYEISKLIQPYLCLIFTNSKEEADELFQQLIPYGLNVGLLHGGLTPRERKRVVKQINDLKYEYVVATDLASRGINIEGLSHVINAQLPQDRESYIHRVGRTARAGLEGNAISIYDKDDIPLLERLDKQGIHLQYVEINNNEFQKARPLKKARYNRRKRR